MVANKLKCVALLPMKANSQRIPGKNFRKLGGKPLFRWILDTLCEVDEIDKIVINTDARAILEQHGLFEDDRIIIRDRKSALCGDSVSMNLIIADDIAAVPANRYLMTHTTNPMLSSNTIREATSLYRSAVKDKIADSLFTVNKLQTRLYREDASPLNHDPERLMQTQDLKPLFEENSNLYIFSQESFLGSGARIGRKPIMHPMQALEAVDIDTPEDWQLAQLVAENYLALIKQRRF